jgi:hypothetical protein
MQLFIPPWAFDGIAESFVGTRAEDLVLRRGWKLFCALYPERMMYVEVLDGDVLLIKLNARDKT